MRRALLALVCIIAGCAGHVPPIPSGETTVVWISIDGFRGDYLYRIKPPLLSRLARDGASTSQERPIFPSLTFPNHIAQVTGATVDQHGIPMNSFYDPQTQQTYTFPEDGSLMRAEPIWVTAKRQNLRVAVVDWPMSHSQTGPFRSDYFETHFDTSETDAHRLEKVIDILHGDHAEKPLRLVMSYVSHVDSVGHRFGPDSPEVRAALIELDGTLDRFVRSTTQWFDATHRPGDELYFLFTADHGMTQVYTMVNLDRLIGANLSTNAKIVTSGPIASIYLTGISPDAKARRIRDILNQLKTNSFLQAWPADDVPSSLHYSDPDRIGDVVVLLSPGYSFSSQRLAATRLVTIGEGRATHGYDPAVCPEMRGEAIIWRYHHSLGGRDIGPVDNTQWAATVARLLNIQPSSKSDPRAITP